jgi:hypothetical protein
MLLTSFRSGHFGLRSARLSILLATTVLIVTPWLIVAPALGQPQKNSSDLSVRPSDRLQNMARRGSERLSSGEVMEEIKVTYSGKQAVKVVLVASLICDGERVCAQERSRPVAMPPGETRSAGSMLGESRLFKNGTLTDVSCCEGQASIGPEGISLKQAQAAFGASFLRARDVLVIAAVPAEGGPSITKPLAVSLVIP